MPLRKYAGIILANAVPQIRYTLGKKCKLKYIPDVRFRMEDEEMAKKQSSEFSALKEAMAEVRRRLS